MYLNGQKDGRVGHVSIDIKGKSYRLRCTYPQGARHEIMIAKVSDEGWVTAVKAAQMITRDIDLGDFDDTYARYSPKHARKLELAQKKANKEYSLKDLWENYKEAKKAIVAKTSQNNGWKALDRLLSKLPPEALDLKTPEKLLEEALQIYAAGTFDRLLVDLYGAVNLAVEQGKINKNPYQGVKKDMNALTKANKSKKSECFEDGEVEIIIEAFKKDTFKNPKSAYSDSYYAPYVEFLALTGCRPEEACALTWDDIKFKKDRTYIRLNKVWSKGVLLPHTKTKEIRLFPCNAQMTAFLARCPKTGNPNNLVFPSTEGGYIDHHNFRNRYWARIVKGLVAQGKIYQYLKPYCLRHTFITRLIREGVDPATVAAIAGTSTEMIVKNYLASKRDFEVPEL